MAIDTSDVVFTVEKAAEYARVSPDKIREWFDLGLRHMRTATNQNRTGPRMIIVRKSKLLEFIEAHEVGALVHKPIEPDQPSKKSPRNPAKFDLSDWLAGGRQ